MTRTWIIVGLGALAFSACRSGSSSAPIGDAGAGGVDACSTGDEGCPCYANSTCNGALSCLSVGGQSVCVDASGSSDGGTGSDVGGAPGNPDGGTDGDPTAGANQGGSDAGAPSAGSANGGSANGGSASGGSANAGSANGGSTSGGSASGGSGGTGGGGTGSGGTNAAGSGGNGGGPSLNLIDDFADCDADIIEVDGRKGDWFDLSSTPQSFNTGLPPTLAWVNQSCGAYETGYCPACSTAGIGVILAPGVYNLAKFSGIKVKYESEASIFVRVKATDGQSYTYASSGMIAPTAPETTATILFAAMTQDSGFQGFNKADEIHFTISTADKAAGYGIGIHRLELLP